MKDQFCSYEIASALKKLGFDEECLAYYWNNKNFTEPIFMLGHVKKLHSKINTKAPLWQQAIDWLLINYQTSVEMSQLVSGKHYCKITYFKNRLLINESFETIEIGKSENYNLLREQAILKSIELIKTK